MPTLQHGVNADVVDSVMCLLVGLLTFALVQDFDGTTCGMMHVALSASCRRVTSWEPARTDSCLKRRLEKNGEEDWWEKQQRGCWIAALGWSNEQGLLRTLTREKHQELAAPTLRYEPEQWIAT